MITCRPTVHNPPRDVDEAPDDVDDGEVPVDTHGRGANLRKSHMLRLVTGTNHNILWFGA